MTSRSRKAGITIEGVGELTGALDNFSAQMRALGLSMSQALAVPVVAFGRLAMEQARDEEERRARLAMRETMEAIAIGHRNAFKAYAQSAPEASAPELPARRRGLRLTR